MSTVEKVTVTADHIKHGMPKSSCSCPIALAILEQRPDLENELEVLGDRVIVAVRDDVIQEAMLPELAASFVARFDDLESVEPFEFEMTWREPAR